MPTAFVTELTDTILPGLLTNVGEIAVAAVAIGAALFGLRLAWRAVHSVAS